MANKKIVVALGRNAFSESFPKQQERVKLAAKAIADLVEEKYDVVIQFDGDGQHSAKYIDLLVKEIEKLGRKAIYIPRFDDIVKYIKERAMPNDIVLTLGAGTVTNIGPMLLQQ